MLYMLIYSLRAYKCSTLKAGGEAVRLRMAEDSSGSSLEVVWDETRIGVGGVVALQGLVNRYPIHPTVDIFVPRTQHVNLGKVSGKGGGRV